MRRNRVSRIGVGMVAGGIVVAGMAGVASPAAAVSTPLPISSVTGGGFGGSGWGNDFYNGGRVCQSTDGFAISEAELNVSNLPPIGDQGDAFDDAWLLADGAGGTADNYYNAPSPVDLTDATITAGAVPLGGLQVSTQYKIFQDAARARILYTFENTTGSPVTHTFQTETNVGSDDDTQISDDYDGNGSWTPSDRWINTWEYTATPPPGDPVNSTVLFGPGTVQTPTIVSFDCTSTVATPGAVGSAREEMRSVWDVTVPAGQTRYLAFFSELSQTTADATAAMSIYANPPASLFEGIPTAERSKILNWELVTPPGVVTDAATGVTDTGATLNGTVTTNGADTDAGFEYGSDPDTSTWTTVQATQSPVAEPATNAAVSKAVSGLSPGTTYYFRTTADNGVGGVKKGETLSFKTTGSSAKLPQSQKAVKTKLRKGSNVVNPSGATTVQGLPQSARVSGSSFKSLATRGDLTCFRVKKGSNRKLTLNVTGQCKKLRIKVTYSAPGNDTYDPYRKTITFKYR